MNETYRSGNLDFYLAFARQPYPWRICGPDYYQMWLDSSLLRTQEMKDGLQPGDSLGGLPGGVSIGRNSNTFLHALRSDFEVRNPNLRKSILLIFPSAGRTTYSERKLPPTVG